jgi:hypothetical protein
MPNRPLAPAPPPLPPSTKLDGPKPRNHGFSLGYIRKARSRVDVSGIAPTLPFDARPCPEPRCTDAQQTTAARNRQCLPPDNAPWPFAVQGWRCRPSGLSALVGSVSSAKGACLTRSAHRPTRRAHHGSRRWRSPNAPGAQQAPPQATWPRIDAPRQPPAPRTARPRRYATATGGCARRLTSGTLTARCRSVSARAAHERRLEGRDQPRPD